MDRYSVRLKGFALAVLAGIVLLQAPRPAAALSIVEKRLSRYARIKVGGECAPYFRGRFQVRPLPRTLSCPVFADISLSALFDTGGFPENQHATFRIINRQGRIHRGLPGARGTVRVQGSEEIVVYLTRNAPTFQLFSTVKFRGGTTDPLAKVSLRGIPADLLSPGPPFIPVILPDTCAGVTEDFSAEQSGIRSCTTDAECGLALQGIGCGCSRAPIARFDADPTRLYALLDRSVELQCDLLPINTACDCPEADGMKCIAGQCEWNYIDTSIN